MYLHVLQGLLEKTPAGRLDWPLLLDHEFVKLTEESLPQTSSPALRSFTDELAKRSQPSATAATGSKHDFTNGQPSSERQQVQLKQQGGQIKPERVAASSTPGLVVQAQGRPMSTVNNRTPMSNVLPPSPYEN